MLLPLLALGALGLLAGARPALAAPAAPNAVDPTAPLWLTMTVGTTAGACAATNSVTVAAGTPVTICYEMRNNTAAAATGPLTLTNHLLADADIDPIYLHFDNPLLPGASVTRTLVYTPTSTIARTDVWAASSGAQQLQTSATANITVVRPAVAAAHTVGRAAGECPTTTAITVPLASPIYFCITLSNTGDAPLVRHQLTLSAFSGANGNTWTFSQTIPSGGALPITSANAATFGLPSLTLNPNANTQSAVTVASYTAEGFSASATASVSVTTGTITTTLAATAHDSDRCGDNNQVSNVVTGLTVYYCLRLTNNGNTALTHHVVGVTGATPAAFDYTLAPAATLVITSSTLTAQGGAPLLGPTTIVTNVAPSFVVTSSAAGGFQTSSSASLSLVASTATPTPTPTWTPSPTWTPFPTWTPWPVTPTWTPWPTWTPTETPPQPTPTWTRSYDLSNLQTPTPGPPAFPQGVPPAQDPNAFLTPPPVDPAQGGPFIDPFATPLLSGDPNAPAGGAPIDTGVIEQPPSPLVAIAADTATPTATPTIEPTRTPLPTQTPSPTMTPTATQRPVVLPGAQGSGGAATGFGNLFATVLDAAIAATGLLFVITGTVIFFGVLGAVAGFGFLRASRRPYELHEASDGENADFAATAPTATPVAKPAGRPSAAAPPDDHWPTSLP